MEAKIIKKHCERPERAEFKMFTYKEVMNILLDYKNQLTTPSKPSDEEITKQSILNCTKAKNDDRLNLDRITWAKGAKWLRDNYQQPLPKITIDPYNESEEDWSEYYSEDTKGQQQQIDWEKVEKDFHYYMVNTFRLGLSAKDFDLTIKFFKSQLKQEGVKEWCKCDIPKKYAKDNSICRKCKLKINTK